MEPAKSSREFAAAALEAKRLRAKVGAHRPPTTASLTLHMAFRSAHTESRSTALANCGMCGDNEEEISAVLFEEFTQMCKSTHSA